MHQEDPQSAIRCSPERPQWYALFVRSNQEKQVAQGLSAREIEHFLPCYSSLRQWKDRRVCLEMPLFPGYVFVRVALAERIRALTVPNVVALAGAKNAPSSIPDREINWIRMGLQHGQAAPTPYLRIGQRVLIIAGAMAGMEGFVLEKRNRTRVIVVLDSIARAFSVEVDAGSLTVCAFYAGDPVIAGVTPPAAADDGKSYCRIPCLQPVI